MKSRSFSPPLQLTNKGELSLFFTGVGSAFTKAHFQTNFLIVKGDDHLMVDCGTRTSQAFNELGLSIADIDTFLITHSHADHIGGMEEALLTARYLKNKRLNLILPVPYRRVLWNYSLKGGVAFNEIRDGKELNFSDVARLRTPKPYKGFGRDAYHYRHGSIDLKLIRTMHIPDNAGSWKDSFWSTALLIDDRVFFTGDTRFDPKLITSVESACAPELIIHDCQFFTGGVHAGFEEIKTLPEETRKKTLLVHYGDNWKKFGSDVKKAGFAGLVRQWVHYDFPSISQ